MKVTLTDVEAVLEVSQYSGRLLNDVALATTGNEQLTMPASNEPTSTWFPVARLLRPQGRRGEVLADPLSDLGELFTPGTIFRRASDSMPPGIAPEVSLEDCWRPQGRNAGRLVLKFADVDSITAAEALNGQHLFLPEDALPALAPDTYLVRDLLGCRLYDGAALIGTVVDLQFPVTPDGRTRVTEAADLLVIETEGATPETDPVLVPFVKAWITSLDLSRKRLQMQLPPGLLDAPSPEGAF